MKKLYYSLLVCIFILFSKMMVFADIIDPRNPNAPRPNRNLPWKPITIPFPNPEEPAEPTTEPTVENIIGIVVGLLIVCTLIYMVKSIKKSKKRYSL